MSVRIEKRINESSCGTVVSEFAFGLLFCVVSTPWVLIESDDKTPTDRIARHAGWGYEVPICIDHIIERREILNAENERPIEDNSLAANKQRNA